MKNNANQTRFLKVSVVVKVKYFHPRALALQLIDEVMMYATGQARNGGNDDSHLTYLLAYTGPPSAILWLI